MGDPDLMGHRRRDTDAPFRLSMGHRWCKTIRTYIVHLVCGHSVLRAGPFCKGAHCEECLHPHWETDRRPTWLKALLRRQMH